MIEEQKASKAQAAEESITVSVTLSEREDLQVEATLPEEEVKGGGEEDQKEKKEDETEEAKIESVEPPPESGEKAEPSETKGDVDRPGSKLSRIEEEPEPENTSLQTG